MMRLLTQYPTQFLPARNAMGHYGGASGVNLGLLDRHPDFFCLVQL